MKRPIAAVDQKDINPAIFQDLPVELVPKILSYAGLPKTLLMQCCQYLYRYFCCINHLTTDAKARDNWKSVCQHYPWLIAANQYDCQRIYYLLIQEDNLPLMEQLLKVDGRRKKNMKEVIVQSFNKPFGFIGSGQMRDLIKDTCFGENGDTQVNNPMFYDGLCMRCFINHYNPCYSMARYNQEMAQPKDALVNCIMTNAMAGLANIEVGKNIDKKSFCCNNSYYFISNFFIRFFIFCSDTSREKLIAFFKSSGLNKKYQILETAMCTALENNDDDRAQYFVNQGADVNAWIRSMNKVPVRMAIYDHDGIRHDDYKMLIFLAKNRASFDLNTETGDCGFSLEILDEETVKRALASYSDSVQDRLYVSPLMYAVIKGNCKLVELLLEYGANACAPQVCAETDVENEFKAIAHIDLLTVAQALGNQEIIDAIAQARALRGSVVAPDPAINNQDDFVDSLWS